MMKMPRIQLPRWFGDETPRGRARRVWLWLAASALLLAAVAVAGLALTRPSFRPLYFYAEESPSRIFTIDGKELGVIADPLARRSLRPDSIPDLVKKGAILTLDPDFEAHSGINIRGKSTISVLLARRLYQEQGGRAPGPLSKIQEIFTALALERAFTKDEIVSHFLNYAAFGGTIYSLENAAQQYFGKTAARLAPEECAMLAGMLRAPTAYHPRLHPERARKRRDETLRLLAAGGALTDSAFAEARVAPLELAESEPKPPEAGRALYFQEYVKNELEAWRKKEGYDFSLDGLRIYTSLHSRIQAHAERAARLHLQKHQRKLDDHVRRTRLFRQNPDILNRAMRQTSRYKAYKAKGLSAEAIKDSFALARPMRVFAWNEAGYTDTIMSPRDSLAYHARLLHAGMMAVDPHSGHVLAWVGGLNKEFFQYDHVAQSRRQVGSTFKPFVYATAFKEGKIPCDRLLNQPPRIRTKEGEIWSPQNADHDYGDLVSLRYGIVHSINVVTARLIDEVGPEKVVEYAKAAGVTSPLEPEPSVALGTFELTVKELTGAYIPFAAGGVYREPIAVLRVEDRYGNILKIFESDRRRTLGPVTAHTMVEMLRGVATTGTAGNLRWRFDLPYYMDLCGKTGTTQNSSDGWFAGFTPHLVAGVWAGCHDRRVNFGHHAYGRGANMAMPVWGRFMRAVYEDDSLPYDPKDKIEPPKNFNISTWCPGDPVRKKDDDSTATDSLDADSLDFPDAAPLPGESDDFDRPEGPEPGDAAFDEEEE